MTNHQIYALLKYYYVLKSIREKLRIKHGQGVCNEDNKEMEVLEVKIRSINHTIKAYCAINNSLLKKDDLEKAKGRLNTIKEH